MDDEAICEHCGATFPMMDVHECEESERYYAALKATEVLSDD